MYILKNAWTNIVRGKGRNILIGIIIIVVTVSACIALSINKSGSKLVESYKTSNPTEITFSLDMMSLRGARQDNSELTVDSLDEDSIKEYGNSTYVKDFYYTYSSILSSSDIDPIDMSEVFNSTDNETDSNKPEGFSNHKMMNQGDFKFAAYSDVAYIENFINGTNKIISGEMFTNKSEDNVIVISSDLASENDLEVGDKVKFYDPDDEDTTFEFEIIGIYEDTSVSNDENFMNMNAMNSQNQIYTTVNAIKTIIGDDTTNSITAKYYLNSSTDIDVFTKEVREKGLSEYYKINDNLDTILETLEPIQNVSSFSITFLIIILIVGGLVMGIINMINIRERKYEIGVLRAIGMNKFKVCLQLISEIFIVAIISLVIGTTIGCAISQPVTNKMLESEINSYTEEQENIENNFGGRNFNRKGFEEKNKDVDYVTDLKVNVDLITIIELFGVSIFLTVISGAISVIFINKYEPNKILQNRT